MRAWHWRNCWQNRWKSRKRRRRRKKNAGEGKEKYILRIATLSQPPFTLAGNQAARSSSTPNSNLANIPHMTNQSQYHPEAGAVGGGKKKVQSPSPEVRHYSVIHGFHVHPTLPPATQGLLFCFFFGFLCTQEQS